MPNLKSPLLVGGASERRDFLGQVDAMAATTVEACYQCGKCSGGCPLSFAMDYQPRQVMRLIQLGLAEEALASRTIWVCATCFTCTARCPRDIDIASVMDALRVLARRRRIQPGDGNVVVFHRSFLNSVRRYGRSHELGLLLGYKLGTLRLTEDLVLGARMLAKGKLSILPETAKGRAEIAAIFAEAARGEGADVGSAGPRAAGAGSPTAEAGKAGEAGERP